MTLENLSGIWAFFLAIVDSSLIDQMKKVMAVVKSVIALFFFFFFWFYHWLK